MVTKYLMNINVDTKKIESWRYNNLNATCNFNWRKNSRNDITPSPFLTFAAYLTQVMLRRTMIRCPPKPVNEADEFNISLLDQKEVRIADKYREIKLLENLFLETC